MYLSTTTNHSHFSLYNPSIHLKVPTFLTSAKELYSKFSIGFFDMRSFEKRIKKRRKKTWLTKWNGNAPCSENEKKNSAIRNVWTIASNDNINAFFRPGSCRYMWIRWRLTALTFWGISILFVEIFWFWFTLQYIFW